MDFIERIFGFSPDGGDGSFEFMLFLVPIVLIVLVAYWRRPARTTRLKKRDE